MFGKINLQENYSKSMLGVSVIVYNITKSVIYLHDIMVQLLWCDAVENHSMAGHSGCHIACHGFEVLM